VIEFVNTFVYPATFALLPAKMDTIGARGFMNAIGVQESAFAERRQLEGGPARGFWQFEKGGGIRGVLHHASTRTHLLRVLEELRYEPTVDACYAAVEHNDVLAAAFARLNLWWLPGRLPASNDPERGWKLYLEAWRPGAPRPDKWAESWRRGWSTVLLDL
jgi:hypothetical protein